MEAALFFLCLFAAGCKEPEITSPGILPDSDKLGLLSTDTSTVISFTIPDDSIRSDETSLSLLGVYNDPVFGVAKASVYTQVRLSAENVDFGNTSDLRIDSVILSLVYTGKYGNTYPQSFKVFELSEDMYKDSNYYSTKTFLYKVPEIGKVTNLVPNMEDSAVVGGLAEPPQLRIALNKSVGDQLIKAGSDKYQNNTAFLNYFKGLFIVADTSVLPSPGDGAILYFNLLSPYSKLTVYYTSGNYHSIHQNPVETEKLKFDFFINENCARMTNFGFNRSGTSLFAGDLINGNHQVYIQSMSGAKAKIKLPFLENYIAKGRVAVNKAEIILNVEDNSTDVFSPHTNLFLTDIDSAGNAGFLIDQFEENYGGSYNPATGQYVFDITRHVQYLLTGFYEGKNSDYGLYLMAGGKSVNANRTILKGNKNADGGVKLKISYTPL